MPIKLWIIKWAKITNEPTLLYKSLKDKMLDDIWCLLLMLANKVFCIVADWGIGPNFRFEVKKGLPRKDDWEFPAQRAHNEGKISTDI